MTCHLSTRVAWHMDGWNGLVCQNPERNTYCIGPKSYPGQMIREQRNLKLEQENVGVSMLGTQLFPSMCL